VDDGELTKTGKIRREFVLNKYRELYEALYDEGVEVKSVQATYQYRDGQSTSVETRMRFYSLPG
jgi:long-chain acyl-CoA synthetase